jgi:hypothetical protein
VCLQVLHAAASAANFLGGGDFRGSTLLIVLDVSLLSLEGYVSRTNPWDQQTLIGYCGKPVDERERVGEKLYGIRGYADARSLPVGS